VTLNNFIEVNLEVMVTYPLYLIKLRIDGHLTIIFKYA